MEKKAFIKSTPQARKFLNQALPKLSNKDHKFDGKYIHVHDNKITFECIDSLDLAIHVRITLEALASWFWKANWKPIPVEKDIPIPTQKLHYSMFPFQNMEVGDSFFVDRGRFKKYHLYYLRTYLYNKSKEYKMDNYVDDRFSFKIDRAMQGVRCFRIE